MLVCVVTAFPILVPVIAYLVFAPALSGTFLFDDWTNLAALERVIPFSWTSLATYIGNGVAGPTGRPLALITFLLHAPAWPYDPEPFLFTNLLIHSAVGVLVFALIRRLALLSNSRSPCSAGWFALIATCIWLLHPLQISTVFYTVQRMTLLSGLFTVAALYAYTVGRDRITDHNRPSGFCAIALCPLLAALGFYCKEISALVPLGVATIELYFFQPSRQNRTPVRLVRILYVWIPLLLLCGFLINAGFSKGYDARDFSVGERLLTQPRIVLHYLSILVLPSQLTNGIYNDTTQVSHGLFQPGSTVAAIVLCVILLTFAVRYRSRFPFLTWGLVFFFSMHALEATTVPLELYFEHRNYVPSIGISTAITALLFTLYSFRKYLGVVATVGVLIAITALGHLRAVSWGQPLQQAAAWARINPDSPRTWQHLARINLGRGADGGVLNALDHWQRLQPENLMPELSRLTYECPPKAISKVKMRRLARLATQSPYQHGTIRSLQMLADQTLNGDCRGLRLDQIHVLARSLLDNDNVNREFTRQRLWNLDANLLLSAGFTEDAMRAFARSHRYESDTPMLLTQARTLARHGQPSEALRLLNQFAGSQKASVHSPLHPYWWLEKKGKVKRLKTSIADQQTSQ